MRALSEVFRAKLLADVRRRGLPGMTAETLAPVLAAARHDWVVYAKLPFGGPKQVLRYLARYTHRIAIGDHRLLRSTTNPSPSNGRTIATANSTKQMTLDGAVFLRRFLQHVLPRSYTRLRSFGFLANNGKREKLAAIRALLDAAAPAPTEARVCLCPICGVGTLVHQQLLEPWTLLPRSNTS